MANFFSVKDDPIRQGVIFTRISNPASVANIDVVYLAADPAGTPEPGPAALKKITGVTSTLAIFVPYTAAP